VAWIYRLGKDENEKLTYELDPEKLSKAVRELFPEKTLYSSEY